MILGSPDQFIFDYSTFHFISRGKKEFFWTSLKIIVISG